MKNTKITKKNNYYCNATFQLPDCQEEKCRISWDRQWLKLQTDNETVQYHCKELIL